ncbi:MAG TPA: hypothetical protein VGI21_21400 [Streptosporangiaceae bacterium]|jgi:hypothetical protein
MTNRRCAQCGTVFTPRREHARFCSAECRVGWNRDHLTDAVAEERALEWSLTGMQDVIEQLDADQPADPAAAFSAVAEAVWWTTIIDARLIRQYMDLYDAVLDAHLPADRPMIEGTLAGLRFVRNQMSADERRRFIEPPASGDDEVAVTAAWRWAHQPVPELSGLPAHMQPWVMTRYQAYEQWLAGGSVGRVFRRAGGFLNLAASRVTAATVTSLG